MIKLIGVAGGTGKLRLLMGVTAILLVTACGSGDDE
jgi:hypothetical protein